MVRGSMVGLALTATAAHAPTGGCWPPDRHGWPSSSASRSGSAFGMPPPARRPPTAELLRPRHWPAAARGYLRCRPALSRPTIARAGPRGRRSGRFAAEAREQWTWAALRAQTVEQGGGS